MATMTLQQPPGGTATSMGAAALIAGFSDGLGQPFDLTMGISWPDEDLNETYDGGVNIGQNLARLLMGGV